MSAAIVFGVWLAGVVVTAAVIGVARRGSWDGEANIRDVWMCAFWPLAWFALLVMFVADLAGGRIR